MTEHRPTGFPYPTKGVGDLEVTEANLKPKPGYNHPPTKHSPDTCLCLANV